MTQLFYVLIGLWAISQASGDHGKPNIVIMMADDLGFDDVSFRGSNEFLTPNIDALAYSGVILNNLYTAAMCTPSRATLLTGKYPLNTGMQHYVIPNDEPWGLSVNETTMGQIFQQNGYYTSLIGKWHLGMARKAFTPLYRGFNQHYGYLGAYVDYYDQTLFEVHANYSRGIDFRDNLKVDRSKNGSYVTDVLTEAAVKRIEEHNFEKKPLFMLLSHLAPHAGNEDNPMQAPKEDVDKFAYIKDPKRRTYAAMVSKLDDSVGVVVESLRKRKVLDNTIIVFLSDNGGPTLGMHSTKASNFPLRGQKNSPWEGAIRSSAAIWSSNLEQRGTIWRQKFYIADFLPTLAAAAGISLDLESLKLDGLNLWSALKYGYSSVEREIMHNIDEKFKYEVYAKGKWKFINGSTVDGKYDGWLSVRPSNESKEIDPRAEHYEDVIKSSTTWANLNSVSSTPISASLLAQRSQTATRCQYEHNEENDGTHCNPLSSPCLFDLDADPCEQNNLYEKYQNSIIVTSILERLAYFRAHAHPLNNKPADPRCDPANYNYEWTWWQDILEGNSVAKVFASNYKHLLFISCIVLYIGHAYIDFYR